MPMTGPGMAAQIQQQFAAEGKTFTPQAASAWATICTAIVTYIQANANVNVTVASVSAVTPGIGVSGPGSGIGTIA
jgi:hypothetical protein